MNEKLGQETHQSQFKLVDNSNSFQSSSRLGTQKKDMVKFLTLPLKKKTTHTSRMKAKLSIGLAGQEGKEEKEEGMLKPTKKIQMKTVFHQQSHGRHKTEKAMMKHGDLIRDRKDFTVLMEQQQAVLELSLITKQSTISVMKKTIEKEEKQLREVEATIETENLKFEEVLRQNEKKSVEARTFFELEARSKQERNGKIKKLLTEIWFTKSELTKLEEILNNYKRYKELLFKLSPQEWQQAKKTTIFEVLSYKDNPEEWSSEPGVESKASSPSRELISNGRNNLSSTHYNTLTRSCSLMGDSAGYEDEQLLYYSDPKELLDLVSEVIEQNLTLIQNSSRVVETREDVRQSVDTTRIKFQKDEEHLTRQINDMKWRTAKEKEKGSNLKRKVQLHVSLNTADQDVMWDTLDEKVAEVHHCCVDERMTNLSTLEKLTDIENSLSLMLLSVGSIPEECLGMIRKIKDSERRSRHRVERLEEKREKQRERMRRYLEKSLADSKRISTRKLMPRCMPVAQEVCGHLDEPSAQDKVHAFLPFETKKTK